MLCTCIGFPGYDNGLGFPFFIQLHSSVSPFAFVAPLFWGALAKKKVKEKTEGVGWMDGWMEDRS